MSGSSDNEQQSTSRVAKPQKRKTTAEIRDINKEKERVQREGSDETLQAAHQYLNQWVQDRGSWKFNKAKQLWLLRHIYSDTKIPSALFPSALQYFAAAGDGLKKTMVDNARLVCHPMSANTDELRALRNKIIGVVGVRMTKGEIRSMKRVATKKVTDGEAEPKTEAKPEEEIREGASEDIVERAEKVIEALTATPPSATAAAPTLVELKRKAEDIDSESDSDSESEDEVPKKKSKSSKENKEKSKSKSKSKDKKDKKDKESKKDKKSKDKKPKDKKSKDKKSKDKKDKKSKK